MFHLFFSLAFGFLTTIHPISTITTVPLPIQNVQIETKTVELIIEGMSCQKGCADGIDRQLKSTKGIIRSRTKFDTGTSKVTFNPKEITVQEIVKTIESLDFKIAKIKE